MALKMQAIDTANNTETLSTQQVVDILGQFLKEQIALHTADCASVESETGGTFVTEDLPPLGDVARHCFLWFVPTGCENDPLVDVSKGGTCERFPGKMFGARTMDEAHDKALAAGPAWKGFRPSEGDRITDALLPLVDKFLGSIPKLVAHEKRVTRADVIKADTGLSFEDAMKQVKAEDKAAVNNESEDGPKDAPSPVLDDMFDSE